MLGEIIINIIIIIIIIIIINIINPGKCLLILHLNLVEHTLYSSFKKTYCILYNKIYNTKR